MAELHSGFKLLGNISGAGLYKCEGMINPTAAQDYVTKNYADTISGAQTNYLLLSGANANQNLNIGAWSYICTGRLDVNNGRLQDEGLGYLKLQSYSSLPLYINPEGNSIQLGNGNGITNALDPINCTKVISGAGFTTTGTISGANVAVSGLTNGRVVYVSGGRLFDNTNFNYDGVNLGIGTAAPGHKLNINDGTGNYFPLSLTSGSIGTLGNYIGILFGYYDSSYQKGAIIYEGQDGNGRGKMYFCLEPSANSTNVGISDKVMTLDYNGNCDVIGLLSGGTIKAANGFTGTGAYTTFTISGGIVLAAS